MAMASTPSLNASSRLLVWPTGSSGRSIAFLRAPASSARSTGRRIPASAAAHDEEQRQDDGRDLEHHATILRPRAVTG